MFDRVFMIFNVSELGQININEVLETSPETVKLSVDGTKTFVKWEGEQVPPSVNALTTKEGPYTYEEMLSILSTSAWFTPSVPITNPPENPTV